MSGVSAASTVSGASEASEPPRIAKGGPPPNACVACLAAIRQVMSRLSNNQVRYQSNGNRSRARDPMCRRGRAHRNTCVAQAIREVDQSESYAKLEEMLRDRLSRLQRLDSDNEEQVGHGAGVGRPRCSALH